MFFFKGEIPGCHEIINGVCNLKIDSVENKMDVAKQQWTKYKGYLPRLTSEQDFDIITAFAFQGDSRPIWTSLTTDISP